MGDWTTLDVTWVPPHLGQTPYSDVLSIDLSIITGTDADGVRTLDDCQEWDGVPDLHPRSIDGLGDRACFLHTKYGITANIDVRTRNVVIEVSYGPPATGSAPALSEQQGEHAVRTMVAEVLR
ncbi:MAG TPA: hypothetical protein VHZ97_06435, partial [Pseudonocardiaceae bacterium]|nr:hypothetical protein [Pseudonocardiaceae bacterium]